MRKAVYYHAKGRVLRCKTRPFIFPPSLGGQAAYRLAAARRRLHAYQAAKRGVDAGVLEQVSLDVAAPTSIAPIEQGNGVPHIRLTHKQA